MYFVSIYNQRLLVYLQQSLTTMPHFSTAAGLPAQASTARPSSLAKVETETAALL
jgi:hypothetical protein